MSYIFDSGIKNFESGVCFGLSSKFVGVARVYQNENHGGSSRNLILNFLFCLIECITWFNLETIVVVPTTWSSVVGFGKNPEGTFPKHHAPSCTFRRLKIHYFLLRSKWMPCHELWSGSDHFLRLCDRFQ